MTPPRISVVITTYNRSRLLPRAIESAQSAGTNLEVIVVDDCSNDDTSEVCARIPGIRYVRLSANRGLANARNVGIAESSSEFIAFLDDDDLRLPGSLDKQLHAITADERIALCYGQALIGDARRQLPTGELYPLECPQGDIFWDLLEHNFIPVPAVLARKSSLLKEGCFNTDLGLIEDWDMWLRLSERYLVAAVAEPSRDLPEGRRRIGPDVFKFRGALQAGTACAADGSRSTARPFFGADEAPFSAPEIPRPGV